MEPSHIYGVGEFRQNATEIIKQVESTAQTVVVSRHGKPVVEIRAVTRSSVNLLGSVTVDNGVDLTSPVVDSGAWSATK